MTSDYYAYCAYGDSLVGRPVDGFIRYSEKGGRPWLILYVCADNGIGHYGKNSPDRQKGTHVPLLIYAPGMTKRGEQDVLVNMSDMLPTIAELGGVKLPDDYEINGESLVPFLFGDQATHREWIYGYKGAMQIVDREVGAHLKRLEDEGLA